MRQMRRRKVEGGMERQFCIALIASKPFLAITAAALDVEAIESPVFRTIARWCTRYHRQYGEAPGASIEPLYHTWAEKEEDKDTVEAVHDLLESLSDQYETAGDINVPYLTDQLSRYLGLQRAARLRDTLDDAILNGNAEATIEAVNEFSTVDLGARTGADALNDREMVDRIFGEQLEPLLFFPNDAGRFLNYAFTPDTLVGVQGPEKRGKTFWCIEFAVRALRARNKVAFFEVGDLSESQLMRRFGVRWSAHPLLKKYCGEIEVPRTLVRRTGDDNDEERVVVGRSKTMICNTPLTPRSFLRGRRKFKKQCRVPRNKPYLMTSVHPNTSINVHGIESILQRWEYELDFVPDIIIVDYADILLPESNKHDARDEVNDTWKALRRLSQERHCCVIVPTQADADSYKRETMGMANFSEDKRKLAHVTGMLGLNQTPEEKDRGVMRLNWIVLRESPFSSRQCLHVGQCLPLSRAFCCGLL